MFVYDLTYFDGYKSRAFNRVAAIKSITFSSGQSQRTITQIFDRMEVEVRKTGESQELSTGERSVVISWEA